MELGMAGSGYVFVSSDHMGLKKNIPKAMNVVRCVIEALYWLHALRFRQLWLIVLKTEVDVVVLGFPTNP